MNCINATFCISCKSGSSTKRSTKPPYCKCNLTGTYLSGNNCLDCNIKCAECTGSATNCTTCKTGNRTDAPTCACLPGYTEVT